MRAISPVIATVIIVSVAIAISIAVALWLTGITSGFTQTENLQIISAYATWNSAGSYWNITIEVKNTGTVSATIDNIFVNGQPLPAKNVTITLPYTISSGQTSTFYVILYKGAGFSHGQMVNIKIHTASGRDYPVTVTLP